MNNLIRFKSRHDLDSVLRERTRISDSPTLMDVLAGAWPTGWTPQADVTATEDAYIVLLDLPGLSKDDVEITIQDRSLRVEGERKSPQADDTDTFTRRERATGHFQRHFVLPKSIKANAVKATFDRGVLRIQIPITDDHKARKVTIQ